MTSAGYPQLVPHVMIRNAVLTWIRAAGVVAALLVCAAAGAILWDTVHYAMTDGWVELRPLFASFSFAGTIRLLAAAILYGLVSCGLLIGLYALRYDFGRLKRWLDLLTRFLAGLPLLLIVSVLLTPFNSIASANWLGEVMFIAVVGFASVPTAMVILAETESEDAAAIGAAANLGLARRYIFLAVQLYGNLRRVALALAVGACRTVAEITLLMKVSESSATNNSDDFLSMASSVAQSIHVRDNLLLIFIILGLSLAGRGLLLLAGTGRQ